MNYLSLSIFWRCGFVTYLRGHVRRNLTSYVLAFSVQSLIIAYFWWQRGDILELARALDHGSPYMRDFVRSYYPMSKQILLPSPRLAPGYYYSAFFALLLAPIGTLELSSAVTVWGLLQLLALLAIILITGRSMLKLPASGMAIYSALWTTSYPILHNIRWGQVSLLLMACVFPALHLSNIKRSTLAGVILGFATAIKYYPVLFATYFLVRRDYRAFISFTISLAFFYVLLPVTLIGADNWYTLERAATNSLGKVTWFDDDVNSQYFSHVITRWLSTLVGQAPTATRANMLSTVSLVLAAMCFALGLRMQRGSLDKQTCLPIASICLATPFLLKTSWPHYFVYLPFCQTAVYCYTLSSLPSNSLLEKAASALSVLSMVLSSMFFFDAFDSWKTYNKYGMLLASNIILLIALSAIVVSESVNAQSQKGFANG